MDDAPAKPPRASPSNEGGRTLWQINWNDQTDEPMVTMMDISNIELREGDDFKPKVTIDDETGDIVVFEQNAQELEDKLQSEQGIYKKSPTFQGKGKSNIYRDKSLEGQRYLIRSRSESDLELYSPEPKKFQICSRVRWCLLSCRTLEFWRHYWWIAGVIILSILIYATITVLILKTLLSW